MLHVQRSSPWLQCDTVLSCCRADSLHSSLMRGRMHTEQEAARLLVIRLTCRHCSRHRVGFRPHLEDSLHQLPSSRCASWPSARYAAP